MFLFWFALVYSLLMSLTMLGLGALFQRRPPRRINNIYGYRTDMSMKNAKTWDFAHRYAGRVWVRCGWLNLVVSLLVLVPLRNSPQFEHVMTWLLPFQMVFLLAVIPFTERALRQRFDKAGKPREQK